jgi:hypothetical protein
MQRVIITIKGAGFEDVEDGELLELPKAGDPIETKYGTCIVTEAAASEGSYDGRIVCRFP